jgi:diguanylate cyclase (GGDEF)-like protein
MGVTRDDGYLRFRRNSVRLASASSLFAVAMISGYAGLTWGDRPNRGGLLLLAAIVIVTVVAVEALRAERLVDTRWCDLFFGVWSTLYVLMIVTLAALDGGIGSPLAMTFFPVLVFAGLCYPLALAAYIGAGCMAGYVALGVFTPEAGIDDSLYVAGCLALTAIMCSWQAWSLERQRRELQEMSRTDYLTGALNRRGFADHAERVLERARHSGEPVALVLLDLDGFKAVNDRHGHAAGDDLLRWVVERVRAGSRPDDAVGRLGGDEFALLLPTLGATEAREIAERLRGTLAERVDVSLGVSEYTSRTDTDGLLADADGELYRDKSRRSRSRMPGVPLELPGELAR